MEQRSLISIILFLILSSICGAVLVALAVGMVIVLIGLAILPIYLIIDARDQNKKISKCDSRVKINKSELVRVDNKYYVIFYKWPGHAVGIYCGNNVTKDTELVEIDLSKAIFLKGEKNRAYARSVACVYDHIFFPSDYRPECKS